MQVPPLRERKEEIPILLKHFMSRMSERYARAPLQMSSSFLQACLDYPWPGNLRELNNFIKRYIVLGDEQAAIKELQPKADGAGRNLRHGGKGHGVCRGIEVSGTQRQGWRRS